MAKAASDPLKKPRQEKEVLGLSSLLVHSFFPFCNHCRTKNGFMITTKETKRGSLAAGRGAYNQYGPYWYRAGASLFIDSPGCTPGKGNESLAAPPGFKLQITKYKIQTEEAPFGPMFTPAAAKTVISDSTAGAWRMLDSRSRLHNCPDTISTIKGWTGLVRQRNILSTPQHLSLTKAKRSKVPADSPFLTKNKSTPRSKNALQRRLT
jgi:hypothetical protein